MVLVILPFIKVRYEKQISLFLLLSLLYLFSHLETKSTTNVEHLTASNVFHFEMRKVQLKIGFVKGNESATINTVAEENYCIADNIEFFITKITEN